MIKKKTNFSLKRKKILVFHHVYILAQTFVDCTIYIISQFVFDNKTCSYYVFGIWKSMFPIEKNFLLIYTASTE